MKTVTVPISDVAEETWRKEAARQGKSVEQLIGAVIEEDARRRAEEWLAAELEVGLQALEEDRTVTVESGKLADHIRDRYRARG